MLNIERYKKELETRTINLDCYTQTLKANIERRTLNGNCASKTCEECRKENLEWLLSEHQILDDAEKRYLKGVIRPFRNEVKSIRKVSAVSERIVIQMRSFLDINLPCFEKGTMYQGMEENRRYTIEELGL